MTKICTKCTKEKDLEKYSNDKRGKYSKNSVCKDCVKLYTLSRKEIKQAQDKQRYENNSEEIKEKVRKWEREHPEQKLATTNAWQSKNKDKVNGYKRNNKYKRREIINSSELTSKELASWENQALKSCSYCGTNCTDDYQVDHIEPLSKGGAHSLDNLAIACPSCNRRKSARSLILWLALKNNF